MARAGCGVIACARSEEELKDLVLEMHGDSHEYRVLDLEDLGEVRRIAKEISDSGPVEILLNNSGWVGSMGFSEDKTPRSKAATRKCLISTSPSSMA